MEKLRSEIHREVQATDEEKSRGHCFNDPRRWSKKKKEIAELILGCCFRSEIEAKIERDESSG